LLNTLFKEPLWGKFWLRELFSRLGVELLVPGSPLLGSPAAQQSLPPFQQPLLIVTDESMEMTAIHNFFYSHSL